MILRREESSIDRHPVASGKADADTGVYLAGV